MKKIFIVTMVLILSISSITQTFAFDETELISAEEFTKAVIGIFEKYGLNCEVLDISGYEPITRNIFNFELNKLENNIINNIKDCNVTNKKALELQKELELQNANEVSEVLSPQLMEITVVLEGSKKMILDASFAYCTIGYGTVAVYNGSNGNYISIESPGQWYKVIAANCTGIKYERKRWTFGGNSACADAAGYISYEYTLKGVNFSAEQPFVILQSFKSK